MGEKVAYIIVNINVRYRKGKQGKLYPDSIVTLTLAIPVMPIQKETTQRLMSSFVIS